MFRSIWLKLQETLQIPCRIMPGKVGVELVLRAKETLVIGDPARLQQITLNLLTMQSSFRSGNRLLKWRRLSKISLANSLL